MAGYELVTTAPDPGTAVFRSRGDRLASPTHEGSRHGPPDYADGETGGAFADGFMSLELDTAEPVGRGRAARSRNRTRVTPTPSAARSGCAEPAGTP